MTYKHSSFITTKWEINTDTIHLLKTLDRLGVSLKAEDHPTFQPEFISLKKRSLPIAWVVCIWRYDIIGTDGNPVFRYHAEDKYEINPDCYTKSGVIEMMKESYDLFSNEFIKRLNFSDLDGGIKNLSEEEFISFYENLQTVMSSKGFEPMI